MKLIQTHLKEIGIILSYVAMLCATYFYDWKPFGIFISYFIEVLVMLLAYLMLRIIEENKNPQLFKNSQPIINIIIGMIPLVLFQFFIIALMASNLNESEDIQKHDLILTKEVLFAFGSFTFLYLLKAFQLSKNKERLIIFQNNFLYKILALSLTNFLGFILIFSLEMNSFLIILSAMVIIRIALEIYFERKFTLI